MNLNGHESLNTLFRHSLNLLRELSTTEEKGYGESDAVVNSNSYCAIFVVHTLGGLIVKDVRLSSPFLCIYQVIVQ